jgi:hypothetical protein
MKVSQCAAQPRGRGGDAGTELQVLHVLLLLFPCGPLPGFPPAAPGPAPPGRTTETVRADIVYLMSRFNSSKALLRQDGRPVYFVYDSYRIAPADWAHLLTPQGQATVRGTDWDGAYVCGRDFTSSCTRCRQV